MRSLKKKELFRYKKDTDQRRKVPPDTRKGEVSQEESMIKCLRTMPIEKKLSI
jgi:hypothetical protein